MKFTLIIIATVVLAAASIALGTWVFMLLLGALAALTGWPVAIGFWACLILNVILGLILSGLSRK